MRPLFTLPLPGPLVTSLSKAGFITCEDLFDANSGCNEVALGILRNHGYSWDLVRSYMEPPGPSTALQLLTKEWSRESIATFSEGVDCLLGGGVHLGSLLHVTGHPGSGKTQFLLQLCVTVQIPVILGGLGGQAVFIDTESSFTVSRLTEMAEGALNHCIQVAKVNNIRLDELAGFSVESALNSLLYISVEDVTQLMASFHSLCELLSTDSKIKLLVIDSLTFPLLRVTNTLDRTRYINTMINDLETMASKYKMAVVFTNHLTTKINFSTSNDSNEEMVYNEIDNKLVVQDTGGTCSNQRDYASKTLTPSLGESLSHRVSTTLLLAKLPSGKSYSAAVYKSSEIAQQVVHFQISDRGIRDC